MFGLLFLNTLTRCVKVPNAPVMYDDLNDVLRELNSRLVRAASDRQSPMHTPAVVTSDIDVRTMVLRATNSSDWTLRFHTDIRAPKVASIEADPRMAVLFYDKGAKVQIRVRGTGRILRDEPVTDLAWEKSDNFARRCYLGEGPGTGSQQPTTGLPPEFRGVEPTDQQLVGARENFAVLVVEMVDLDWFYLAHTGHIRAQFTRGEAREWEGRWVAP